MNKPFFVVPSITYAMKGRNLLLHHGIRSSVERSRKKLGSSGCGYGIYVPDRTEEAEALLRRYGVRIVERTERDEAL